MPDLRDVFSNFTSRPKTEDGVFSLDEVRLANRNAGALLETLTQDITPTGAHYLLNHFDVPMIAPADHRLEFGAGFENPFSIGVSDIQALPQKSMPVTMECAGNGRTGVSPRAHSMPWSHEAFGTSIWTGTPLLPLIEKARPKAGTMEISFTGADYGFDKGVPHAFGRSLSLEQLADLDVLLVTEMNGQPLLPQHGAPLRIIVPGWYGMASVKWLTRIEALGEPYKGFQQVETYRYRSHPDEPGRPVTEIKVKSLMAPPGVPDWVTRDRFCAPGPVTITGRAWSGAGTEVTKVEFGVDDHWTDAQLSRPVGPHAWSKWQAHWVAEPGTHILQCRAHDASGAVQPLVAEFDLAGFANNAVQSVPVLVAEITKGD